MFRETALGLGRHGNTGRVVRAEKKWRRLVDQCSRSARPRVAESSGHDPRNGPQNGGFKKRVAPKRGGICIMCIYVYMYICIYVYMYICIYVYMYICIYVYMYICIYVYDIYDIYDIYIYISYMIYIYISLFLVMQYLLSIYPGLKTKWFIVAKRRHGVTISWPSRGPGHGIPRCLDGIHGAPLI